MTIELGNRLAELRKKHGLSQEELADQLGVSRQAVSKWERGEASPDTDNLIELARIYGISLDELLGLKKEEEEKPDNENINVHISSEEGDVHVSGKAHIKDEDGNEVHIDSDGIHIVDEDGSEVHVTNKGVTIKDEDGEHHHARVSVLHEKKHRIMITPSNLVPSLMIERTPTTDLLNAASVMIHPSEIKEEVISALLIFEGGRLRMWV